MMFVSVPLPDREQKVIEITVMWADPKKVPQKVLLTITLLQIV